MAMWRQWHTGTAPCDNGRGERYVAISQGLPKLAAKPPEAKMRQMGAPPWVPEGAGPANTLVLGLRPPASEMVHSHCLKPPHGRHCQADLSHWYGFQNHSWLHLLHPCRKPVGLAMLLSEGRYVPVSPRAPSMVLHASESSMYLCNVLSQVWTADTKSNSQL